jgi:hypothetical protein
VADQVPRPRQVAADCDRRFEQSAKTLPNPPYDRMNFVPILLRNVPLVEGRYLRVFRGGDRKRLFAPWRISRIAPSLIHASSSTTSKL